MYRKMTKVNDLCAYSFNFNPVCLNLGYTGYKLAGYLATSYRRISGRGI